MKRTAIILLGGIVLALLACFGSYAWLTASHRAMMNSSQPELAWLQREFNLGDAEFARIEQLHQEYLPQCAEMCARIDATNALIRQRVEEATGVTPELEKLLNDAAQLRAQCQRQMLDHFYAVSRAMPPEQGRRYLAWVQDRVFAMSHEPVERAKPSSAHGH